MIRLSKPSISEEAILEVTDILRTGMLVQGETVMKFEKSLKEYMNASYVTAVSSGTAALHIALAALDIGEGDAVFIPSFTYPATANVVELQKARTILVDVEDQTYNLDATKLEEAITSYDGPEKPKAIIVVHEFGAPANMKSIMEIAKKYGLFVIEDAACALGTTYEGQHVGTIGDVGCFSFHPRKAITTGEGGAIITKNEQLFNKINLLRNHGVTKLPDGKMDFILPGFNYRLTEFQAVLGLHQIKLFDSWKNKREILVNSYINLLCELPLIKLPLQLEGHAWQTFMIVLDDKLNRDNIIQRLKSKGIESNIGAQALQMLSYYKEKYPHIQNDLSVSATLFKQGLALPLHPELTEEDITYIVNSLKETIE